MAARKPTMTPAPERPDLEKLIADASAKPVTDDELREQMASFVYGNAPVGSGITKESAKKAAETSRLIVA